MPTYDKAYFIAKFEAIPEERIVAGHRSHYNDAKEYCACALLQLDSLNGERQALHDLFTPARMNGPHINDGKDVRYPQPTPKGRIIAAMRDLP